MDLLNYMGDINGREPSNKKDDCFRAVITSRIKHSWNG